MDRKIYTKTGDHGTTSLLCDGRVSKSSAVMEAIGTLDELNSHLGVVIAEQPQPEIRSILARVQGELFKVGTELLLRASAQKRKERKATKKESFPSEDHAYSPSFSEMIDRLEQEIDHSESCLSPLHSFILPGGSKVSAQLHVARTVCRRAERRTIAVFEHSGDQSCNTSVIAYLNRLSDLLFVLARRENESSVVR